MSVWIGSVLCPSVLWQRIIEILCWLLPMIGSSVLMSKPPAVTGAMLDKHALSGVAYSMRTHRFLKIFKKLVGLRFL